MSPQELAGVVLAAGEGKRLRPLTRLRPKALCPIDGVPLLDLALARLSAALGAGAGPDRLAVNAAYLAEQVVAHVGDHVTVSREAPEALGTAGALGQLRDWIGGRDVLVVNSDAYLPGGLGSFTAGWDGKRSRLLCAPVPGPGDFPELTRGPRTAAPPGPWTAGLRYVGACLLPWQAVQRFEPVPTGLYEVLWRQELHEHGLDLVTMAEAGIDGVVIDCGTPRDYLEANLHASGGRTVAGAGAVVEGLAERCVIWDGAWVGPDEHLLEVIRAGDRSHPVTVIAAG